MELPLRYEAKQYRTDYKGLILIALPISIGTFVQFLVLLTDNYFLARVSEAAINGAGNAGLDIFDIWDVDLW